MTFNWKEEFRSWRQKAPEFVKDDELRITEMEQAIIDQGGIDALVDRVNNRWPERFIREFNFRLRAFHVNQWLSERDRFFAIYLMVRPRVERAIHRQLEREACRENILRYITRARIRGDSAKTIDRNVRESFTSPTNGFGITWAESRKIRQHVDDNLDKYAARFDSRGDRNNNDVNVISVSFRRGGK